MSQNELIEIKKLFSKATTRIVWSIISSFVIAIVWVSVRYGDWQEWRHSTDKRLDAVEMVVSRPGAAMARTIK